jgi:hypothetical protein
MGVCNGVTKTLFLTNTQKKEIAWCKIRRTGRPKEKIVVSIYSTSDPVLYKNTSEKHSYISLKMVEELLPVVECNRHNWYSVGATNSFSTCPEKSRQAQVLQ